MISNLTGFHTATGVAIVIGTDGQPVMNTCQISKKNNQLSFDKKISGISSIKDLRKHLPAKALLSINISGKGILYKQMEKILQISPANFGQIWPNAKFEDFYIQNFITGDHSFIAVIRKTEADKSLQQFREEGFHPVMLSLGPFPVSAVLPQLNIYDEEVRFDGHIISRNEQKDWVKYLYDVSATAPFPIKVETEPMNERVLLAYASAFQLLMGHQLELVQASVAALDQSYREALSNQKIKAYGMLVLAGLFLLLLINFMVFSYYDSINTALALQVSRSAQNTNEVKDRTDQIRNKEQQLHDLGWDGGISKAYLTDQLAAQMPAEITWKQVEINPIDMNSSRNQKTLFFKDRFIRISGTSQKIIPVNEWMARMKTTPWVKDIQLENYSFNNEWNTGQFTVAITY